MNELLSQVSKRAKKNVYLAYLSSIYKPQGNSQVSSSDGSFSDSVINVSEERLGEVFSTTVYQDQTTALFADQLNSLGDKLMFFFKSLEIIEPTNTKALSLWAQDINDALKVDLKDVLKNVQKDIIVKTLQRFSHIPNGYIQRVISDTVNDRSDRKFLIVFLEVYNDLISSKKRTHEIFESAHGFLDLIISSKLFHPIRHNGLKSLTLYILEIYLYQVK